MCITETITPGYITEWTRKVYEAKAKNIKRSLVNGEFKIVDGINLLHHTNILGGRFVLTIKSVGTQGEARKARFVV